MKVTSKSNSVIRDLVASLENADVVDQAMAMDETEADTTMVNEEINELSQEMYSIENHIDEAISIVEEDSDLADYAEARSEEKEEVPSMESFVLMMNAYNERSRRCFGKADTTVSMEAAEEFAKDEDEGKKGKLKALAGAAKERAGKIIESIINAIKDMVGKLNEFRKALFDKSLKLTKQATELKGSLSDDKTEEKEVKASRAVKALCVNGEFDLKNFTVVEDNMKTVEDYLKNLLNALEAGKNAPNETASWEAVAQVVEKKIEMKGTWKNEGEHEILTAHMPGDIILSRDLVEMEMSAEGTTSIFKYSLSKDPNAKGETPENIPFLKKDQREKLVDVALELAKTVSEAKRDWKDLDDALNKVKKALEKDFKASYEDKAEAKVEFKEVVKAIKTVLSNVKTCSGDMQKYSLTQAEALLALVREHDKVASGSKKAEKKEGEEAAA